MIMKKYIEETKAVGFRVPLSEIGNVRKLVYGYLDSKIEIKESTSIGAIRHNPITMDHDNNHILSHQCGCTYSNNLFQRKKGCGLTKVQHTEAIGSAVIKLTTNNDNNDGNTTSKRDD